MDLVGLIMALSSGGAGGYVAAKLASRLSHGANEHMIAGPMGGLLGTQVVERAMGIAPAADSVGLDLGMLAAQAAGGGAGGVAFVLGVGSLRAMLTR